jgi:DNA-binding HxlR family transcriptional regulator
LFCLKRGTRRFNELQRSIPDISKKMLTQTLRKLERRGLLDRLVHPVVPPHVDYTLTPVGTKFAEAVALLCAWAQKNKSILKRVDAYERTTDWHLRRRLFKSRKEKAEGVLGKLKDRSAARS